MVEETKADDEGPRKGGADSMPPPPLPAGRAPGGRDAGSPGGAAMMPPPSMPPPPLPPAAARKTGLEKGDVSTRAEGAAPTQKLPTARSEHHRELSGDEARHKDDAEAASMPPPSMPPPSMPPPSMPPPSMPPPSMPPPPPPRPGAAKEQGHEGTATGRPAASSSRAGGGSEPDVEPRRSRRPPQDYDEPEWSGIPADKFGFEVIKSGMVVGTENLSRADRGYALLGRAADVVDIVLAHPSISRVHAAVQFRTGDRTPYLIDLRSTHGTAVNKKKLEAGKYVALSVGDVIKFGDSTRIYVLTGPDDIKANPLEPSVDPRALEAERQREAERQADREERKKLQEVSWGFGEDAPEEEDDETEPQGVDYEKLTRDRLSKPQQQRLDRIEAKKTKLTNMEAELSNIKAKEVSSELTEGQARRISFLEERISKFGEEIDDAYAQLHADVTKSAQPPKRARKRASKAAEEDLRDDDDDDFFDRTQEDGRARQLETAANEKSLRQRSAELERQVTEAREKRDQVRNELSSLHRTGGDSLDEFFSDNERAIKEQELKKAEDRRRQLEEELASCRRLLAIAAPVDFKPESMAATATAGEPRAPKEPTGRPVPAAEAASRPKPQLGIRDANGEADENGDGNRPGEELEDREGPDAPTSLPDRYHSPRPQASNEEANEPAPKPPARKRARAVGPQRPPRELTRTDADEGLYTWKPPEDQRGDGKTDLNDKYGY